uniref:Putative capsid protein n=1 Tax=viral metagenome TaxID=1070528 RepID=A0A6M3M1B6_9ZZZZ
MAYTGTAYGDITPRQAAYSVAGFLSRAIPNMTIERFGQTFVVPTNSTQTAKFRRYFLEGGTGSYSGEAGNYNMPIATTALTEGVTPVGKKLASKDYTVQMQQYGDFVGFTDVIQDTHEDYPALLRELMNLLGDEAALTVETLRFNVLKSGTNVFYANGSSRAAVNTPITLDLQRRITRSLKRQNAPMITSVIKSSPAYNTQPIEAAFVALVHPDVENDIRDMDGFISTKHYASVTPFAGELGSVEDVRYIRSTVIEPWADAGGAAGDMISTTGTAADVYPILYMARDAFGVVVLRGKNVATIMVVQPKPTSEDPLAQRGTAGWKLWNATVILQDAFLVRSEVAASN